MNRTLAYVLGPELIWLLLLILTGFLTARNDPPTVAGNQSLESLGWLLALGSVAVSFVPLAWAPGSPWWWLLRIGLTGLVGVLLVIGTLCTGIKYGDSRDSGVGTGYVLFVGLGYIALFLGGLGAGLYFVIRR